MITDSQTNKVYFSRRLTWYKCWPKLKEILSNAKIDFDLLDNTKDKWARDYMPIQVEKGKFITYVYNPDYLQEDKKSITVWTEIPNLPSMPEKVETKLIIDGGNVIKCSDKVIMTDKVFLENRRLQFSKKEIQEELERLFGRVIIIPWNSQDKWDFCGHSDGMIRYIDHDYVLINNYCNHKENEWLLKDIKNILKTNNIKYEQLDYGKGYQEVNDWAYLNFLQVGNKIFIPTIDNQDLDTKALKQLESIYNKCEIFPVPLLSIIKANGKYCGGALNCISWNIYSE
jgi:agmatine/peptidylarginine deiminase